MNGVSNELTSFYNHARQTPPTKRKLRVQKNNNRAVEAI